MANKPKIPQKFKDFVVDCIRRHKWNMGVSHYEGVIEYMPEDKTSSDLLPGQTTNADILVDLRYYKYTIRIFPNLMRKWQKYGNEAEEDIAHEMAHILTEPLKFCAEAAYKTDSEVRDTNEQLVELISRISVKLSNEYLKKPLQKNKKRRR